jgi:GNAT superfamily N-acetyltransferase
MPDNFQLRPATIEDAGLILEFIRELAEYEKLLDRVVATEKLLRQHLFGERPMAEVVIGYEGTVPVAFALFFHNFSTFLGRPGIYLEDLFVKPNYRRKGYGRRILTWLARLAVDRGCGRLEWSVLDWNKPAIDFYLSLGAQPLEEWTTFRLSGEALEAVGRMAVDQ